jgi:hypothetical protein
LLDSPIAFASALVAERLLVRDVRDDVRLVRLEVRLEARELVEAFGLVAAVG